MDDTLKDSRATRFEGTLVAAWAPDEGEQLDTFEFAGYRAARDQGVTRNGVAISLSPKEFGVLEALLRREGKLATKGKLLDEVWPEEDVGEESLTRCIYILRRRLPVSGQTSIIETMYGRGYRIAVPIVRRSDKLPGTTIAQANDISPAAHAAYLEGRHHSRLMLPDAHVTALKYFEVARRYNARCTSAIVATADCHIAQTILRAGSRQSAEMARNACEEALAIDPNLASAHAALGWLDGAIHRKAEQGLAQLDRALSLDSRSGQIYHYRAWVLRCMGRHEEAVADLRRACALDPFMPLYSISLCWTLFLQGRISEALAINTSTAQSWWVDESYRVLALSANCMAHSYRGNVLEASAAADLMVELALKAPGLAGFAAYSLARGSRKDESSMLLGQMAGDDKVVLRSMLPAVYLALGDRRKALECVADAADEHCPALLAEIQDPRNELLGLRAESFLRRR